ncbi:MAG: HEAT repeat domain-containing protein [Bacteroidaceae bacterium]|nr:HEAT repeat domain-containing protein [Bacteroidaceae bacterium]
MTDNYKDLSITREEVLTAKTKGQDELKRLIQSARNSGELVFILENIGSIPLSFGADCFLSLIEYENKDVRFWAIKNLGKLKSIELLPVFMHIINTESNTSVKREAVSSIGRMRRTEAIPSLISILKDSDPKIVCQAIRGLLVFKGCKEVDTKLKALKDHENEMVVSVIKKEYFGNESTKKDILPHYETYPFLVNTVVKGDVRDIMHYVPDQSVHLTFTSPPYYNARDYSIYPSYEAYLKFLADVFSEVYRITKEGRFLIVNTSPVIVPRISRAHSSKRYPIPFDIHHDLIKMGWEFIDDIIWMKPEYSVKNRIGGFQQHRRPLAYKPNTVTEYLMVYRKQTTRLIDWNIHQYSDKIIEESKVPDNFETTNVWQICPKSDKVHSAIFPYDLCKRVIEYYSFVGDLIFDPFGGSGTVGRTAKKLNRRFFLAEKDPVYFEYMKSFQRENIFEGTPTHFLTLNQFKSTIL